MNISYIVILSIIVSSSIIVGILGLQYYYANNVYSSLKYEVEHVVMLYKSIVNVISLNVGGSFPVRLSFGKLSLFDDGFILIDFNDRCLFAAMNYIVNYACKMNLYGSEETLISHGSLNDFSFQIFGIGNNIFLRFKPLVKMSEGKIFISCVVLYKSKLGVIVDGTLNVNSEVEYLKYTFSPMQGGTYFLRVTYGSSTDEFSVYASPENPITIIIKVLKVRWG